MLEERRLLETQLVDLRKLYEQQLLPYPRLSEAELALTQATGSEGRLHAAIAADKGKPRRAPRHQDPDFAHLARRSGRADRAAAGLERPAHRAGGTGP